MRVAHFSLLGALLLFNNPALAALPIHTIFYGTSANGFTTAVCGWNTFGLQASSAQLKHDAGWDYNDYHFRQQCSLITTQPGYDYVCSIDSGWSSGCNGDVNGIPEPNRNVIPDVVDLGNYLHGKGLKFGLYVLPGAFEQDGKDGKEVEGTNIKIQDLLDFNQPGYNCRRAFDYRKDGVQQWHDSVVRKFASWYFTLVPKNP
jgi:alpha-galactosidase